MAWTTPRTWTAGEVVTAAMMNTHIRDNLNVLKTNIGDDGSIAMSPARARFAGSGTVAGNLLPWGIQDFNTAPGIITRTGANLERITALQAGTYLISANGRSSGTSANGLIRFRMRKNGVDLANYDTGASVGGAGGGAITLLDVAVVNDYYTVMIPDPNPVAESTAKFSIMKIA
jgi:hypothetical protein